MIDPEFTIGVVFTFLPIVLNVLAAVGEPGLLVRYGPILGRLMPIPFPGAVTRLGKIERDILPGPNVADEDRRRANAAEFKADIAGECNMTAVAGAIIASVALSALSLDNLSETHWIARGLFILSLVFFFMSVYYAAIVQRKVGELYDPTQIRDWLSANKTKGDDVVGREPLASLAAVFILSAALFMAACAIAFFLAGLYVYLAFAWLRNLDTDAGRNDNKNVFIMALVGLVWWFFFEVAFQVKNIETLVLRSQRNEIWNGRMKMDSEVYNYARTFGQVRGSEGNLENPHSSRQALHPPTGKDDTVASAPI